MSSKRILSKFQLIVAYIGKHPGAFSTSFAGVCLILNERSGRHDVKEDLSVKIDLVRTEMATKTDLQAVRTEMATKTDLQAVRTEMATKTDLGHTQAIALGSAYAMMKALSGERKMMTTWMRDIENCITLGGQACDPIKGIATVYGNRGNKD